MPTVKTILDIREKSKGKDGSYPIIVRVRDRNKVRDLPTKWRIDQKFWDGEQVGKKHPQHNLINSVISDLVNQAKKYFAACQLSGQPIRIELIGKDNNSYSFNEYLLHRAKQFEQKEMLIMARKTKRFQLDLKDCFGHDLYFDEITADTLRKLEAYLVKKGNINNTRHKKFKFLQEFYTQAVREGKAREPNPFKEYKIAKKPVNKEKLTLGEIAAIENLELNDGALNNDRNLFLFSYYCKGARFENCVTARKADLLNDRVRFRTNKGNKFITVKMHDRLKRLIEQYDCKEFIFPHVKALPTAKIDYINLIGSLNAVVNRNLKTIAALCEINKKLTFHVARHSFAYHLMKHSNIHVIKQALGHSDYRTTEIYLKELSDDIIDGDMDKLYG